VSNWEVGSALKQKLIEYIKMSGIFPKSGLISCSFFDLARLFDRQENLFDG